MSIPKKILDFLAQQGASYEVTHHPHTSSSWQTAIATHVNPSRFAKGVLMHDNEGYFLAVVPASRRINVKTLTEQFGYRPELVLEEDLPRIFSDCARGAVPALGAAYRLDCVVDSSLKDQPEVFLEAGDHDDIIRLDGETFVALMSDARWESISEVPDSL